MHTIAFSFIRNTGIQGKITVSLYPTVGIQYCIAVPNCRTVVLYHCTQLKDCSVLYHCTEPTCRTIVDYCSCGDTQLQCTVELCSVHFVLLHCCITILYCIACIAHYQLYSTAVPYLCSLCILHCRLCAISCLQYLVCNIL